MATFDKDFLYPGTYRLKDGRTFHASAGDVAHLARRLEEMLAAGLQIPVSWEHQGLAPRTKAELSKLTADQTRLTLGHVESASLSPEGFLAGRVAVPVDDDAKRLPAVRFVSPTIAHDWTDGDGRFWPGASVVELAATPRPVQHRQQPFKPVAFSHGAISLSLADYRGDTTMPDDTQKPNDKKPDGEDGGKQLKTVLAALADVGLVLPDDTTPENLLDRLHTAALTKKGPETEAEAVPQAPPPPVGMSLGGKPQPTAAERRLLQLSHKDLQTRADALLSTGRVGPPVHQKLKAELGKVQLSLTAEGELSPSPVLAKIAAYEDLEPSSAWSAQRLSLGAEAIDPPAYLLGGPQSEAETKKAVDGFFALTGGGVPTAGAAK